MDESLHFAFTALGRKEKSRRWPRGRTRDGRWFWDRRHRSLFLKRINKSNRFHHNPPVFMVCSVYHELIPPSPDHSENIKFVLPPHA